MSRTRAARARRGTQLDEYQRKRDFAETPEPAGSTQEPSIAAAPRFVVHQHDATRLHWDLRLEHDGVLASWAIPKGLPRTPERNNLAVHTEDHPLEYIDFEGSIPEGNYGAGQMTVWDRGTYAPIEWEDKKVVVDLRGERAHGRHALFAWKGRDWMIHRMDPAPPGWEDPPADLRPMRARPGRLPTGVGWAHEISWPGRRVLLHCSPGEVDIVDGDGQDVGPGLPEVRRIGRALGSAAAVLDGVVVLLDDGGLPHVDEAALGARLAAHDAKARRLADRHPAAVMLFDVVWSEGRLVDEAYVDRRALLERLELSGPAWQTPAYHEGDATVFAAAVADQGLPGVVSKRLDSRYRPGRTSPDWRASSR